MAYRIFTADKMSKHKHKNKTGAVQARLGAADYITFTTASKHVGKSRSALAKIILTDAAKRILSGELVLVDEPRIAKP